MPECPVRPSDPLLMKPRGWWLLATWCALLLAGVAWIESSLEVSADLRLFMPSPRTEVERKVSVGNWSAAKKSSPRRWASRPSSFVSIDVASISTSTELFAGVSASIWSVPEKAPKRPRVLLMPRWRTEKPTSEWLASSVQVPVAGRVWVVVLMVVAPWGRFLLAK